MTNTVIVGISTDSTERLQRFGESQDVSFPLVSDSEGRVERLYDLRRRLGLGASRATIVIDSEGVIRDVHHGELSMSRHAHRALRWVETLQTEETDLTPV